MHSSPNHIINKLKWDTTFNRKEGSALQNRLSNWTRTNMDRELTRLLDTICPRDQHWRIDSLVVDLGMIDFDNLESQLSYRLKTVLQEKLSDLIKYEQDGELIVEQLDKEVAELADIIKFLRDGVMPWTYQNAHGSLNELIEYHFLNHQQALLINLIEIGKERASVRKRIAWQFNEENIIRLIEGIAPLHHEEVIGFSAELKQIQLKEAIVKGSSNDFSKNIWLWILNFLLVDRGSTFNRIDFMTSTIHQMADHYNISYQQLFMVLRDVTTKRFAHLKITADFIHILNVVSDRFDQSQKALKVNIEADQWISLMAHFSEITIKKTKEEQKKFNGLVAYLAVKDKERFKSLISSTLITKEKSLKFVENLTTDTFDIAFKAINPAYALIQNQIAFLVALTQKKFPAADEKFFRAIALHFMLMDTHRPFLTYAIEEMANRLMIDKDDILAQLAFGKIQQTFKKVEHISSFNLLKTNYDKGFTSKPTIHQIAEIHELILKITVNDQDSSNFYRLRLLRYIEQDPKIVFAALVEFNDKKVLIQFIPYLNTAKTLKLLINNSNKIGQEIYTSLARYFEKVTLNRGRNLFINRLESLLERIAFSAIVFNPTASAEKLWIVVFNELYFELSTTERQSFYAFLDEIKVANEFKALIEIKKLFTQLGVQKPSALLTTLIAGPNQQTIAAKFLKEHFYTPELVKVRNGEGKFASQILDYLLDDGTALWKKIKMEQTTYLTQHMGRRLSVKEVNLLNDIYWQCAAAYEGYRGNVVKFRENLQLMMTLHFLHIRKPKLKNEKANQGSPLDNVSISGTLVTKEKLYHLIETCFKLHCFEAKIANKQVKLAELLTTAMLLEPTMLFALLAKFGTSQFELFKQVVSWKNFNFYLRYHSSIELEKIHGAMSLLQDWISDKALISEDQVLLSLLWELTFSLVRNQKNNTSIMEAIIKRFLLIAAQSGYLKTTQIFEELTMAGLFDHPVLNKLLISQGIGKKIIAENKPLVLIEIELKKVAMGNLIVNLFQQLVILKEIPLWYNQHTADNDLQKLLNELLRQYPIQFLKFIKSRSLSFDQLKWLHQVIDFSVFTKAITITNHTQHSAVQLLHQFYDAIGKVAFNGHSAVIVQEIIHSKLLMAWKENNWKTIAPIQLWNEITWEMKAKGGYKTGPFLTAINKSKTILPPAFQVAFTQLNNRFKESNQIFKPVELRKLPQLGTKPYRSNIPKIGIEIRNAGMVLLNTYIQRLFGFLDLQLGIGSMPTSAMLKDRIGAVHYLQYVVTGSSYTPEELLVLNKVICGLPINEPIPDGIEINEKEKELINGMVKAIIGYWKTIGTTSIAGFRGNWLVRKGLLFEHEERWELHVEKAPYDVLIESSHLPYAIIKYPWMDKPIHVNWT